MCLSGRGDKDLAEALRGLRDSMAEATLAGVEDRRRVRSCARRRPGSPDAYMMGGFPDPETSLAVADAYVDAGGSRGAGRSLLRPAGRRPGDPLRCHKGAGGDLHTTLLDKWIVPYLGRKRLRDITRQTIDTYSAQIRVDGAGAPTVNRALGLLQGVFHRAVEWRRLPWNPVVGVRRVAHTSLPDDRRAQAGDGRADPRAARPTERGARQRARL